MRGRFLICWVVGLTVFTLSGVAHAFVTPAIAAPSTRKSASPRRNSCRTSASGRGALIFVSIGIWLLWRFLLPENLRGRAQPAPSKRKDLLASGRYGSGDLVERRVSDVIGFNLQSSLNYLVEDLRHFGVSSAAVSFGILSLVPQTDCERFRAALANERDFVLESFLFPKQRSDVLLQLLGKLRNAIGLQMHINSACKHDTLLGSRCQGGDSDNHSWLSLSEYSLSLLTMLG